jgi:hypothetical protein
LSPVEVVQEIVASTNKNNPYPEWFRIKDCKKILSELEKKRHPVKEKIFIDISKHSKWDFGEKYDKI